MLTCIVAVLLVIIIPAVIAVVADPAGVDTQ